MAFPRKGARGISVNGEKYLWRVRKEPSYMQAIHNGELAASIQHEDASGPVLLFFTGYERRDNWGSMLAESEMEQGIVTPDDIRAAILFARQKGWKPSDARRKMEIEMRDGEFRVRKNR